MGLLSDLYGKFFLRLTGIMNPSAGSTDRERVKSTQLLILEFEEMLERHRKRFEAIEARSLVGPPGVCGSGPPCKGDVEKGGCIVDCGYNKFF